MATYIVGDIQGCYDPLSRLLDKIRFSPPADTLISVGDLINRGPNNVGVLRLVRSLGSNFRAVLGNHDLSFIAASLGTRALKSKDTTQDILDSPERDAFVSWLRELPLALYNNGYLIVHAGVVPQWSVTQALSYSHEVTAALTSPDAPDFLRNMYGDRPARFKESLRGFERLRVITNVLTRLRFCAADGSMDLKNKQGPEHAPKGMLPWFAHANRQTKDVPIVFGHWAALLGTTRTPNTYALDTGCVWGQALTCMRLEDGQRFECGCS